MECTRSLAGLAAPIILAAGFFTTAGQNAMAQPCEVPDNGSGTIFLPPDGCGYLSPQDVHLIIEGLPPGTTIEVAAEHFKFFNVTRAPGGNLGGEIEQFDSILSMQMTGTGGLAGFNRTLFMQLGCEVHTGPRNPGDPVQTFPNEMVQLQGQIFGDPDFDFIQMTAGSGFGLPSPGQTTLTDLGNGNFNVDSFFDITYKIDFQGAPGSILEGFGGVTEGTVRMQAGEPASGGVCEPDATGFNCAPVACPDPGQACLPTCVNFNPDTGEIRILECDCRFQDECHVQIPGTPQPLAGNPCSVPDNGTGTVTLPPAGCEYLSPDEVHLIIDGLPAGTTIELAPIHKDFICNKGQQNCSVSIPPGECEVPGGNLGGHVDCFDSILELEVTGTGDLAGFNRTLSIPIACEVHTGPRNPGDAVQDFDTDMFRIQGQLFGDPDFCTFRVLGGTDFGLPSPGHTTLTRVGPPGGDFNVDSFFDITYQIDFQGCPGSVLEGFSGITTATIRMQTGGGGGGIPPCVGGCPPGTECVQTVVQNADGTFDICCDCVPIQVEGACCFDSDNDGINESCQVISPMNCQALGGSYQGDGSACLGSGACCLDADGDGIEEQCVEMDRLCCLAVGGTYQGTGVACAGQGACCLDFDGDGIDERCFQIDGLCCEAQGGTFLGPDVVCLGIGACCFDADGDGTNESCVVVDGACCSVIGGTFVGAGSQCLGDLNQNGVDDACEQPQECGPNAAGSACVPVQCPEPGHACLPTKVIYDPANGITRVVECTCIDIDECHVQLPGTPQPLAGNPCTVVDNGSGTVTLPPIGCEYLSPDEVHLIIDGLPAGTTIELAPIHKDFICDKGLQTCSIPIPPGQCETPGGNLGGHVDCFQSTLELQVTGTGLLNGFNRTLFVPIGCEVHTAPRNPGDAVQDFDTDMFRLQGEIFGDPDFCTFRVRGGTDFGLPSPGHTTLTRLGPPGSDFTVDSFFDITYQIEFQGCPGSVLEGFGGVTTATIRMQTGGGGGAPPCIGGCPPGFDCVRTEEDQSDGSILIGCDCVQSPPPCPWDFNGNGMVDFQDLLKLLANWGQCPANCPWDFNGNGIVDFQDLLKLLARWGPCPT